jgi:hypothetical protein
MFLAERLRLVQVGKEAKVWNHLHKPHQQPLGLLACRAQHLVSGQLTIPVLVPLGRNKC